MNTLGSCHQIIDLHLLRMQFLAQAVVRQGFCGFRNVISYAYEVQILHPQGAFPLKYRFDHDSSSCCSILTLLISSLLIGCGLLAVSLTQTPQLSHATFSFLLRRSTLPHCVILPPLSARDCVFELQLLLVELHSEFFPGKASPHRQNLLETGTAFRLTHSVSAAQLH